MLRRPHASARRRRPWPIQPLPARNRERRADEYLEEPRLDYNDGGPVGAEEETDMPPRMQPEVYPFDFNQQVFSQFRTKMFVAMKFGNSCIPICTNVWKFVK